MVTISEVAAEKIKDILNVEGMPGAALRVVASAGSCCGPQYEIMIDEKTGAGDTVVEKNGAKLFLDSSTVTALEGAQLDFISDERGEGFVIAFPNGRPSSGGCGCGPDSAPSGGGCGSGSGSAGGCGCGCG